MEEKSCPDVKSYLDANQFLRDFYHYRKSQEGKFSYEIWARQMGLTSKSYLRFSVLGQRGISAELTQKIADFLKLDEVDREYFNLLVLYTQSSEAEQKKILGRKMTQVLRHLVAMTEIKPEPSVLANPLTLVLRNILSFSDIPRTSESLKKILGLGDQTLEKMLQSLQQEGLIESADGKTWQAVDQVVKVSDKTKAETQLYHKLSLLKAIEAQAIPVDERHFRSIGLALSAEEYRKYLQELDVFIKTTFSKFDGDRILNRRLYQINFNLFPWTATVTQ